MVSTATRPDQWQALGSTSLRRADSRGRANNGSGFVRFVQKMMRLRKCIRPIWELHNRRPSTTLQSLETSFSAGADNDELEDATLPSRGRASRR
jgi:hypothetical protein